MFSMSIPNQMESRLTEQDTGTGRSRGFSMLELMVVLIIITILVGIAIPRYQTMIVSSREKTLKVNLHSLRSVIDQYTADKKKAPQTLQDLVDGGYFRELPLDPITNDRHWREDFDSAVSSADQTDTGITNVHSLSTAVSSEGTTYDTW
jgi:general secretion pathway protein G